MVPTLCARTIGAAGGDGDGVGVGVGVAEGEGDAVAAGPLVVPPHATRSNAEHAPTAAMRKKCMRVTTRQRYGPHPAVPQRARDLSDGVDLDLTLFDPHLQ